MSDAAQCDLCGQLFKRKHGTVRLDVHVTKKDGLSEDNWDDVDFCGNCSRSILVMIGASLQDLMATLKGGKR